ncbi:hypothetical protein [Litorisediminicola beolgyonensis]|uniref:Uncharacterized protein n=1 Tax=Litorisediminicola beolgyonensis TaxID=1173614 RepID=A0ABW3ZM48_9RHOB
MILERDQIVEAMDYIQADPNYSFECTQIAITGPDRCAILFEISDPDHEIRVCVIFDVEGFDPAKARPIMVTDLWMYSLSATSMEDLSALEVGRDIWRGGPDNWARTQAADWFNNQVWCFDPATTFLIGAHGQASRFDGTTYTPIKPAADALLFDIHGLRSDHIYCVGASGTLLRLDGDGWERIDLYSNQRLRGVDATRPELLRVCGDNGVCLEVRNQTEIVPITAPGSYFFTVREWREEVYWGDSWHGVYRQRGTDLEEFHESGMAYDFRCDENFLYSVGTDMAWRFDGDDWKALRLNYADGVFSLV